MTVYSYFIFIFQLLAGSAGFFSNFYRFEYKKQFISHGTLTLSIAGPVEKLMHSISRTYIAISPSCPIELQKLSQGR